MSQINNIQELDNDDFKEFMNSDNVIKTLEGYRTQCSQYSVLLKTEKELRTYFKKNYEL